MSAVTTTRDFLNANGITPQGALLEDLREHEQGLESIAYCINHFAAMPALRENIAELAALPNHGVDDERRYDNLLLEFSGARFVHERMGYNVVSIESSSRSVHSPNRTGNKSCDIEAEKGGVTHFFDVKEMSSEIQSQIPDPTFLGLSSFNVYTPDQWRVWLERMACKCVEKGANFTICLGTIWNAGRKNRKGLHEGWVKEIFETDYTALGNDEYQITHSLALPPFFKGIYVIRPDEFLLLRF